MVDNFMVWMILTQLLYGNGYSLIAPFVPLELERKGIPGAYAGVIYAMFAVAQVIVSPIVGSMFDTIGYKNLLAGGVFLMGIAIVCFGFIKDIESNLTVIVLALICRFIQGVCVGFETTARLIIVTTDYPDQKVELIGYIDAACGTCLITGPILGSILYNQFGFKGCFLIFGGFQIVIGIITRFMLPERRKLDVSA